MTRGRKPSRAGAFNRIVTIFLLTFSLFRDTMSMLKGGIPMEELNEFLQQTVENSHVCAHCIYQHDGGICFFAYDCIKHNFKFFDEGDNEYECVSAES